MANLKDVGGKRPGEEVSTGEIVRAKRAYVLFCISFEQIMYLNILLSIEISLCTMKIASEVHLNVQLISCSFMFLQTARPFEFLSTLVEPLVGN